MSRESHRLAPPTTCCCHGDARCNDHFCARCGTDYPATPAPLDEGVDGVDCDWDERGKCRCRAATPAPLDDAPCGYCGSVDGLTPPGDWENDPIDGATLRLAIENASDLVNPRISEVDWNDVAAHWRVRVVREYAESLGLAATPAPLDVTQKWWAEWFATHTPEQHRELIEGLEAGRKELATPAPLNVDAPDNANAATTSANATPAPLDEQPLFDRIRELNAEVALLKKEAREDRAELKRLATPAPLDVDRLADALTVLPQTAWDPCMAASVDEVAAAIAAAYTEETP